MHRWCSRTTENHKELAAGCIIPVEQKNQVYNTSGTEEPVEVEMSYRRYETEINGSEISSKVDAGFANQLLFMKRQTLFAFKN